MRTAPIEMLDLLQEAANVYPIPRENDLKRMSETYVKALGHFPLDVLKQAFDEYARTSTRGFPKPGNLYPLAKRIEHAPTTNDLEKAHYDWYCGGVNGPCPVCGSVLEIPPPNVQKRARVYHDARRHREMRVPVIGVCA